ncbi:MAG: hypothetical protein ABJA10_09590 [Aestuariivirga sp.]
MSTIVHDLLLSKKGLKTTSPARQAAKINEVHSREEVFKSALDKYIADYRTHHTELAKAIGLQALL